MNERISTKEIDSAAGDLEERLDSLKEYL